MNRTEIKATFTVGLIQMRCADDPSRNLARAAGLLREARDKGADIACLPELFLGPYFCQVEDPSGFDRGMTIPCETTKEIAAVAAETGMAIVAPVFEKRAAGLYHNSAVVFDEKGESLGIYRKTHIPDDPLYYEKYYFTPGDLGFKAFSTRAARIGTLICWDQWFPEAARLTALQGAEILLYPTAIGWHPSEKKTQGEAQKDAWRTAQRAHAIANGLFVAAVNRVGHEGPADAGLDFWGGSFVCDPFGRVLAEGSTDREEVVVAVCDRSLIEQTRRNWPFLRDRRIDAYGDLLKRYGAP